MTDGKTALGELNAMDDAEIWGYSSLAGAVSSTIDLEIGAVALWMVGVVILVAGLDSATEGEEAVANSTGTEVAFASAREASAVASTIDDEGAVGTRSWEVGAVARTTEDEGAVGKANEDRVVLASAIEAGTVARETDGEEAVKS